MLGAESYQECPVSTGSAPAPVSACHPCPLRPTRVTRRTWCPPVPLVSAVSVDPVSACVTRGPVASRSTPLSGRLSGPLWVWAIAGRQPPIRPAPWCSEIGYRRPLDALLDYLTAPASPPAGSVSVRHAGQRSEVASAMWDAEAATWSRSKRHVQGIRAIRRYWGTRWSG